MASIRKVFAGADIFDGSRFHKDAVLVTENGKVLDIAAARTIPGDAEQIVLDGGILAPGYVDLQVNGGGGLMFNAAPSAETLKTMAEAHARVGATSFLPTLITDTPDTTARAVEAVSAAASSIPGISGLHLEGPHLALSRKGAHDPALIRPMTAEDLAALVGAAKRLPVLMVTVAPEAVSPEQIRALSAAGILVSLGHTDSRFDDCEAAAEAGAKCVTHLFNAQSQLGNREPGVVGAALGLGGLSAGLIADGIHVHPVSMAVALRAKQGPGRIFLVSDAMATAGSDIESFTLNGREIRRENNRLTLADGTLAGAHLDLTTAVRNLVELCSIPLQTALAMATSMPAGLIGKDREIGTFQPGARADMVLLSKDLKLISVYREGGKVP